MAIEFQWDPVKAARNLAKHGVSFGEASTVFQDPLSVTVPDPRHSRNEERFAILGRSVHGRFLAVYHTDVDRRVRIISARPATRLEREVYEEESA